MADGLVVWKGEPIISVIPMTATSHPDDFAQIKDTIGLMESDSGPVTPASATHASGPIEIVTADMKRETVDPKTGERLLLGLCMCGTYDEVGNTITGFKFPKMTDKMKKAIAEPIKTKHTHDVKCLFDSANALRS